MEKGIVKMREATGTLGRMTNLMLYPCRETCDRLKSVGFNEECSKYYNGAVAYTGDNTNETLPDGFCSCPETSQVIDWLSSHNGIKVAMVKRKHGFEGVVTDKDGKETFTGKKRMFSKFALMNGIEVALGILGA